MLIPIGDVAPRRSFPWINLLLILANVGIFAWLVLTRGAGYEQVVQAHGLVPEKRRLLSFATSMFLHAGIAHLLGNMLFLWIAGDNVEDRFGGFPYLVFYLACGLAAGAAHLATAVGAERAMPCVGASGAVSGVLGAYLVLFPASRIKMLFWFVIPLFTFRVPTWAAIPAWLVLQGLMAWNQMHGASTQVAVWAHLGGFAFGFGCAVLLRMFGRDRRRRPGF